MSSADIRTSQLIVPHGPGSFYYDKKGTPFIVGGLDFWFRSGIVGGGEYSDASQYELHEERLSELLGVPKFRRPPTFVKVAKGSSRGSHVRRDLPMMRFPSWYRNAVNGKLKRYSIHLERDPETRKGEYWQPVRFIALCRHGHLSDFPWKEFVGCTCVGDYGLVMRDDGGSDLRSVAVRCSTCPPESYSAKWRTLVNSMNREIRRPRSLPEEGGQFIPCSGSRPWLGAETSHEQCDQMIFGALVNQSNVCYPNVITAISLPPVSTNSAELEKVENVLADNTTLLSLALGMWKANLQDAAVKFVLDNYAYASDVLTAENVRSVLKRRVSGSETVEIDDELLPLEPEHKLLMYRRTERNILRSEEIHSMVKDAPLTVKRVGVPEGMNTWIDRVTVVDQLAETRVFCGFDRLVPIRRTPSVQAQHALKQLFLQRPKNEEAWLPAVRVYGEGIYLELCNDPIEQWQSEHREWIEQRFSQQYRASLVRSPSLITPTNAERDLDWVSRFHLVHTLAHLLMNELVFFCGYGASSLRERLFVSSDAKAPMASLLIYTTSGDIFGTLGGLVELGRPETLGRIMRRAIDRARWCSSDPVCSYDIGTHQHDELSSLAACHSCALVPEVSCESMNKGLDRAVLVGLPDQREVGFFRDLL